MSIPIRHSGAVQSSAAAVSYTDFDGATMDYDSGGGFAQITANRVGAFSAGLKLRTILAGVVLTAITFAAAGAATFGFAMSAPGITSTSGLTVSSGTSALQAVTCTTLVGTGALSGFTTVSVTGAILARLDASLIRTVDAAGANQQVAIGSVLGLIGSGSTTTGGMATSGDMTFYPSGGTTARLTINTSTLTVASATTAVQALTAAGAASFGGAFSTGLAGGHIVARNNFGFLSSNAANSGFFGLIYGTPADKVGIDIDGKGTTFGAGISATTGTFGTAGAGFTADGVGIDNGGRVDIGNHYSSGTVTYMRFVNIGVNVIGSISYNGSVTAYNTTSDARLKTDRGVATTTNILRDLVIHDFDWNASGQRDRGVFAQEAVNVKPLAIYVGSGPNDPWGVDYSKFVPDLIVGWQNHEDRLTQLERRIAA